MLFSTRHSVKFRNSAPAVSSFHMKDPVSVTWTFLIIKSLELYNYYSFLFD